MKVMVVGSALMDTLLLNVPELPHGDEQSVDVESWVEAPGGMALNVASQLSGLFGQQDGQTKNEITLLARIPDNQDHSSQVMRDHLARLSIKHIQGSAPEQVGRCCSITIPRAGGQDADRYFFAWAKHVKLRWDDLQQIERHSGNLDWLHFTNFGGESAYLDERVTSMMGRVRSGNPNLKISADTLGVPTELQTYARDASARIDARVLKFIHQLDWLITNGNEASCLDPENADDCDAIFANDPLDLYDAGGLAEKLFDKYNLKGIAIKCGPKGSVAYDGTTVANAPAKVVQRVTDPTGAGDAWSACFICSCLKGLGLQDSLRLANKLAAKCLAVPGGSKPLISFAKLSASSPLRKSP